MKGTVLIYLLHSMNSFHPIFLFLLQDIVELGVSRLHKPPEDTQEYVYCSVHYVLLISIKIGDSVQVL